MADIIRDVGGLKKLDYSVTGSMLVGQQNTPQPWIVQHVPTALKLFLLCYRIRSRVFRFPVVQCMNTGIGVPRGLFVDLDLDVGDLIFCQNLFALGGDVGCVGVAREISGHHTDHDGDSIFAFVPYSAEVDGTPAHVFLRFHNGEEFRKQLLFPDIRIADGFPVRLCLRWSSACTSG